MLKSKKPCVKPKSTLQNSLNKLLIISSVFIVLSCSVLPEGYEENLKNVTWINKEKIGTPTGEADVISKSTFSEDGIYNIEIDHPIDETIRNTFFYETGYYVSKFAIVLYEYSDNVGANPPVIGTPIYYRFEDDFKILVTSTNENMTFAQKWNK